MTPGRMLRASIVLALSASLALALTACENKSGGSSKSSDSAKNQKKGAEKPRVEEKYGVTTDTP